MRAVVPLLLLSCATASPPVQEPEPRLAASVDPPPAYHEYPEIPPDELLAPKPADDTQVCQALPPPPPAPKRVARISSGPPVTNHIPPEVIMRPMRTRAACFHRCYEQAGNPQLRGRVSVQFVVDLDGYVRKSKVKDTELPDASVGACVAKEIVGMQFGEPSGASVTVIYPFTFGP